MIAPPFSRLLAQRVGFHAFQPTADPMVDDDFVITQAHDGGGGDETESREAAPYWLR